MKLGRCDHQFYSLWFDPIGNRTQAYRFSSRRSWLGSTQLLINNQVNSAFASETVGIDSHPDRVKPKLSKLLFTASMLDVQQSKSQCEASDVYGKQVGKWQLEAKDCNVPLLFPKHGNLSNRECPTKSLHVCFTTASVNHSFRSASHHLVIIGHLRRALLTSLDVGYRNILRKKPGPLAFFLM